MRKKPDWLTPKEMQKTERELFDVLFDEILRLEIESIPNYVSHMTWYGYWDEEKEDVLLYIEVYKDGEKLCFNIDVNDTDSEDMMRLEEVFQVTRN